MRRWNSLNLNHYPRRSVKPYPLAETLASMERELANRIAAHGEGHWLVTRQRQLIQIVKQQGELDGDEDHA